VDDNREVELEVAVGPGKVAFALTYSRLGYRVFPAHWIYPDGKCSCRHDCGSPGKHPIEKGWQEQATTDPEGIRFLWKRNPQANIGIACGKGSNLTVLDVDGDVGRDTLHDLEAKHGALPPTPIVLTGGGGLHYYFAFAPSLANAVRFAPGLDIRTEGGLVIGVGSKTRDAYRFEVGAPHLKEGLPQMPEWLIRAVHEKQASKNGAGVKLPDKIFEGKGRNNELYRVGRSLKAKNLPSPAIRAALLEANQLVCKPPMETGEIDKLIANVISQPDSAAFKAETENGRVEVNDEPPRPLTQQIPDAEPYPVDALGPLLAPAATAIAGRAQAPDAIAAQSVLGAAALATQAHADVELPHGKTVPSSLFLSTIADSGDRKSTCDDLAMEPIKGYVRQLVSIHEEEETTYKVNKAVWEKQKAKILGDKNKSFEAKRDELKELLEPQTPLDPMMVCGEPTYEGLVKLLHRGRGLAGVFSSEGGQLIGGFAMSSDNRLKTCAGFSDLWDGKEINRVRGGDGSILLYGRRVSMHLLMQRMVSAGLFNDPLLKDQGILSRFLASMPNSLAGSRAWRESTAEQIDNLTHYKQRMRELLNIPLPLVDGTRNELNPRVLRLSTDAKKLWIAFHDKIESQLAPGGPFEGARPLASKLAEQAARLAGTMARFGDFYAEEMSAELMGGGIALAQFYLKEALRIYRISQIDAELILAKKALSWLQKEWDDACVSLPDLYQYGPYQVRDQATARATVEVLEKHGWLKQVEGGAQVKGTMRREVWSIVKATQ